MAVLGFLRRIVASLSLGLFAVSSAAEAQTLPVIVDATGEHPTAWWLPSGESHAGRLDLALFGMTGRFVSPRVTEPDAPPSALLRRIDITATNARNLAGLYGADRVVVGRIERTGPQVQPWLGLARVGLRLTGELLGVSTGASMGAVDLTSAAYDVDSERAFHLAVDAMATRLGAIVPAEASASTPLPEADGVVVVVRSWQGAAPYVALRGALRAVHPGIVDVMEIWATEGEVALELRLDGAADPEAVRAAIERLEGTDVEGARVRHVESDGESLRIDVVPSPAPTPVPDAPTVQSPL